MRLYIIRHGETLWNTEGKLQGRADIPLNESGIRLAKITSEGMKEIPFDLVITSPLIRARHTAELVLGEREIPMIEDDRIQEISFGEWEGLCIRKNNYQIPTSEFEKFWKSPFSYTPPEGGESADELVKRTEEFWEELIHNPEYQDKTILIASHGCASRGILYHIFKDKENFWQGGVPVNCAVTIVDVEDGNAVIVEKDKIYYDPKDLVDHYNPREIN